MKIRNPRRAVSVLEVVAVSALVAWLWLTYSHYSSNREQFQRSSAELTKSLSLAAPIKKLREKPDQASLESHSERALARAIEQSASEAGITQEHITRIEPQTPRRAGDTSYMEHATIIGLEGVTLPQLAHLATNLRQLDASLGQLHVTTIRVDTPYQQPVEGQAPESWNLEFTLTYFVYSPKNPDPRRG